jgi:hypothetical protein
VLDRRVSFDRAVSREPLAFAADAARMDFKWCFGTFVPYFCARCIVPGWGPAKHGDDPTPDARNEARGLRARRRPDSLPTRSVRRASG